uniref:Small ribosomal subunit protein bS16 n=2 Tax=Planctomycetaceae TaxID=126 RepID=F0SNF1_RUBBR|nr:SSU ribosomal protein S16P [Rubinisphaera brasiliensis DSM 5305]
MSVRIRMKRMGRTHRPFYRICIMDSRKPRDGKTIEEVGTYDPMVQEKSKRVTVDMERIDYWLGVGAQPTEKVGVLLRKVREDNWGVVKQPPPMQAPKAPEPEAAAEEPAAEGEATEEAAAEQTEE